MSKAKAWVAAVAVLAVVAAAGVFVVSRMGGSEEVIVLCGGSMRETLQEIIEQYKGVSGEVVRATYGGSGELCAQIQEGKRCDVFICHDPFMPWAEKKGLIETWAAVGYLDIAIIVRKDDPKTAGMGKIEDLGRPGLRVGIGHQRLSTSGLVVKELLKKIPNRDAILANVAMESKGHQQRCTAVALGSLDAAIVWEPVGRQFEDKLKVIPLRQQYAGLIDTITSATYKDTDLRNVKVTVGLTTTAKDKPAAQRFYEFVVKQGPAVFKAKGFRMAE